MILFECAPPFQWRPSYSHFGDCRRIVWGWLAVTHYPHGINELFEGLGRAGASLYAAGELSARCPHCGEVAKHDGYCGVS